MAQVTSPVFLLSNTKEKLHIARIVARIETAFPDTYAALSEPELFPPVIYYLSFAGFCKKISSTPTHVDLILRMQ